MTTLQAFHYRHPRFCLTLPCDFITEDETIEGRTVDASERGLCVQFAHPLLSGVRGRLRLRLESCWFEVDAEVIYSEIAAAGLAFVFASEAERRFLQSLIRLAARNQERGRGGLRTPLAS